MSFELTTPESIAHASAGAIGIVTGIVALSARKGSRLHRTAGTVFFAVLLLTAATGTYLGFLSEELGNAIAGIVTIYLITTSWVTIRRPEGKIGAFEVGAFLFAAAGAVVAYWAAIAAVRSGTALFGGLPYMIIATIIAIAALADLSVLLRRGLRGKQRVARHLWRMQLGFAAAVGSFFPGQLEHFPEAIQNIRPFILLFNPFFTVIGVMLFWLLYVLVTKKFSGDSGTPATAAP
ncbi:MAG: hypothetical protein ACT4OF_17135 [Caulobacteraceae bacterium]